ncbi:MAG TPA: polysaccharide deacetylase family protein [Gaiellaceae bacterium]
MKRSTQALLLAAGWRAAPAVALASGRFAGRLGYATRVDGGSVALTFDDGPHPEGTAAILATLDELQVPATFFLCGEQVANYPDVAREIAGRGHAVGVHGYRHVLLTLRGQAATSRDLWRACAEIERATGIAPRLYRPPYGVATPAALRAARRLGLRPVLWSRWGRDWERRATAASVAAQATRNLRGGDVLLLHDADHYSAAGSWAVTAAALPRIVETVRAQSLMFVPLR